MEGFYALEESPLAKIHSPSLSRSTNTQSFDAANTFAPTVKWLLVITMDLLHFRGDGLLHGRVVELARVVFYLHHIRITPNGGDDVGALVMCT
jgi:hypothetical protein